MKITVYNLNKDKVAQLLEKIRKACCARRE